MRPEDAKKLLGGYATGTLTEAEQEALFAAALDDQELFDAIAREQSLREVLRDPAVRAELLAALEERPRGWWSWRPAAVLAMAGVAALAVVVVRQKAPAPVPAIVAEVKTPVAEPSRPAAEAVEEPPGRSRPSSREPVSTPARAAGENRGFERQPVVGGVVGGAPSAPMAPPPAPSVPAMALLPTESVAPMRMRAEAQTRLETSSSPRSARELFYGAPAGDVRVQAVAVTAGRRTIGLRYAVLRKEGAEFVEADPETLKLDDTVALRFTANMNGYLSIDGATPVAITAMQPYTTAVEGREVRVVFSRTPETAAEGSVATEARDREIYVVSTAAAPALAFTITLKRN